MTGLPATDIVAGTVLEYHVFLFHPVGRYTVGHVAPAGTVTHFKTVDLLGIQISDGLVYLQPVEFSRLWSTECQGVVGKKLGAGIKVMNPADLRGQIVKIITAV